MTNGQSKFLTPVDVSCKDFHHAWTDKCVNATAGLVLASTPYCLRVYTVVYALSLLMRHRIPNLLDLKRTLLGIIQSTAFLVTNSYTFSLYNCIIRKLLGTYYLPTVAFVPSFLSSLTAIIVERPARRPLLTLYVANVATETLWNMAESRGWVRSLPQGQTLIFGVSVSILLYLYRLGLHKTKCKDSLFNILRIFVGKAEEGPLAPHVNPLAGIENAEISRPRINYATVSGCVQAYGHFIEALKRKHFSCPHKDVCLRYAALGGIKPFLGGITLQVALKLIMNLKKIMQLRMDWRKTIFDKRTLKLGVFLGSFSFLYKAISCTLRHSFGRDDPLFALPAGLIGSIAFTQYPDNTVALYVMWKMLQVIYNFGIEKGVLPQVSGFTLFLYSFCTATLFHAGILEPNTIRPSYMKFLQAISGERLDKFNVAAFDVYGLDSSAKAKAVMESLNVAKTVLPKYPMAW